MSKKWLVRALLIIVGSLTLVSTFFVGYFVVVLHGNSQIVIDLADGGQESIEFNALELVPGESVENTVTLKSAFDGKYRLSFEFNDKNKELSLKNYIRIRMVLDGEEICDRLLADAFDRKPEDILLEMKANDESVLKIEYYMPASIGNEAEKAEAEFGLIINYTNE